MKQGGVEIFQSADGDVQLQVSLDRDTVWLSQRQMAELFDKDVRTVNEHIQNLYEDQEVAEEATIRNFRIVQQEGQRRVTREVAHYNLDVVISVGYRVKSHRGVQFRQWATRVLRQHLVEGYTLNQRRLQERGIEFQQALNLLSSTLQNQQLVTERGVDVLRVVADYARSWSLLQRYDEQSLPEISGKQQQMRALEVNEVLALLVAESKPEQKDLMVRLAEHFVLLGDK